MTDDKPTQRISPEDLDAGMEAAFGKDGAAPGPQRSDAEPLTSLPRVPLRPMQRPPAPPLRPFDVPDEWPLPRYRPLGVVERSPLRVVLGARDRLLQRDVHLKLMGNGHASNPAHAKQFLQAAQVQGRIAASGVPGVLDAGLAADGRPYVVQEPVLGNSLAAILRSRTSPRAELNRHVQVFAEVCDALAAAHERGVVHRFLTPDSVIVDADGRAHVIHWGRCAVTTETDGDTSTSKADERSDVFALGLILAELLTGHVPARDSGRVPPARMLAETLRALADAEADAGLVSLTRRCLAPDRASRPANAGLVARAVHSHLDDLARTAPTRSTAAADGLGAREQTRSRARIEPIPSDSDIETIPASTGPAPAPAAQPAPVSDKGTDAPKTPQPRKPKPVPVIHGKGTPASDDAERLLERERMRTAREAAARRRMQWLAYAATGIVVTLAGVLVWRGSQEGTDDATAMVRTELAKAVALKGEAERTHDALLWRQAMAAAKRAMTLAASADLDASLAREVEVEWKAIAPRAREAVEALNLENKARSLGAKGETQAAIDLWKRVLALAPEREHVHAHIAELHTRAGAHAQAAAAYREAVKLEPTPEVRAKLILALVKAGELNEALGLGEDSVRKHPRSAASHHALGEVWAARGDRNKAIESWRRARESDPAYPPIQSRFTRLYARAAIENNRDVLQGDLFPTAPTERLDLADSCVVAARYFDAQRIYENAFLSDEALARHRGTLDQPRWRAARAAALASCLQGVDARTLERNQQSMLRHKVAGWLRQDLAQWKEELARDPDLAMDVACALTGWTLDPVLQVLQNPTQIYRMPKRDRRELRLFWREVAAVCDQAIHVISGSWSRWQARVRSPLVLVHVAYVLRGLGRYEEALDAYRRADREGRARFSWEMPSTDWIRDVGALIEREGRLEQVLAGKPVLRENETLLTFARLCIHKRRYEAGLQLVERALAQDEDLLKSEGPDSVAVHTAAVCAIGVATSGDAGPERAPEELLARARGWLLAEIERLNYLVYDQDVVRRQVSRRTLELWQRDPHFAPVREPEGFAKLPPGEPSYWKVLWRQVDKLLTNAI